MSEEEDDREARPARVIPERAELEGDRRDAAEAAERHEAGEDGAGDARSPRHSPRSEASATVRFFHWRWKRASKAASFPPQPSRQSDSPTDQESRAAIAIGRKKSTTIWPPQTQVVCWRDRTPKLFPWVAPDRRPAP